MASRWLCCVHSATSTLVSALIDSAGDGNVAIEAFKLHLLAMFEDVDGGAALASHILASVDTCFISGDAAMPYTIRYLEEHIDMRKATAEDDPAYEDKMAEVEMIKAYLVDLVPPKPSATAATPASKGAREQTSPDSLGEAATPVERKMYSKMKEVETKLGAGFDGCEERDEHMLALNKMQLQQMDEDRVAREQQRHDDAVAAQEAKEQREDAERKAQREAERKAIQDRKEDAAARAQALKDTHAVITSSLKQQSVENRSFQKTMAKSEGELLRNAVSNDIKESLGAKEGELDAEFAAGQLAEAEAQRAAQMAKKPPLGVGIAAKAKKLQESANENAGQEVPALLPRTTTAAAATTTSAPVLSAPRRSARGLADPTHV